MDHDDPTLRKPPRAQPQQPDRPGRGTQRQEVDNSPPAGESGDKAEKLRRQEEVAVENVREGYGKT